MGEDEVGPDVWRGVGIPRYFTEVLSAARRDLSRTAYK
jgi:hypothetical protein